MAEKAARKQRGRGRPFKKGQSGNPKGKPRGTRHATTILAESLMGKDVEEIINAVVARAKGGDIAAARLVLDRVVPQRRGRPISIDLPVIRKIGDLTAAQAAVTSAMARGELSPDEADEVASVLERNRKAIETEELVRRITAAEKLLSQSNS